MACCKCCCGGENCTEGHQGKCCCGGPSGTCCQSGEYCCSGACQSTPCCSGACDQENPCRPGCVCLDGECVTAGCCCDGCQILTQYTDQQACEECNSTYSCSEWTYPSCEYAEPDENGNCPDGYTNWWGYYCEKCQPCPDGWTASGYGDCYRQRTVSSCEACYGYCDFLGTTGPCATWKQPCDNCSGGYFQAFDGSNRYFRRLGVYDLDCCYLGSFRPDDGYYVVEKCQDGQCRVVESARWYEANGYAVGATVACPDWVYTRSTTLPNPPVNSATKKSLSYEPPSDPCCNNTDGGNIYAELSDEVNPLP